MRRWDAVIFDTDGVVTRTAAIHVDAWKAVFDRFLADHASGEAARPFSDADYRVHVDGIGRYEGVDAFLRSRGVDLPWGDPTDPPGDATVCAVGNLKNRAFADVIARDGVEPYPTTRRLVELLRRNGIRTAAISASRNMRAVLAAAGVAELFDACVDGDDMAELDLPSKPDPAIFLEAARRLDVDPERAAVVEDAVAGVEAGRAGGFGLVIGIDRTRHPDALAVAADIVVPDAADLGVVDGSITRVPAQAMISDLGDALTDGDLARQLDGRAVALFLDYDGTLTPIVSRPEDAVIDPEVRAVLERLGRVATVAVVSGRDLDDVRAMVGASDVWYAGSHGFDLLSPDGRRTEIDAGSAALPALDAAIAELAGTLVDFPGAWAERKRFAIAVHFRAMDEALESRLVAAVTEVATAHPELRVGGGKKVVELRPAVEWDKGRAVRWLAETVGLDPAVTIEVFVGDDVTDEDGFVEVRERGIGIVVGDGGRPTAAHYRLDDTVAVRRLLDRIAGGLEEAT